MPIFEEKFNESTFGQERGQFVLECGSLWVNESGCKSESMPQESGTTSNQTGWHEMPIVHVVSQSGFDECTYGGYEIIKNCLSNTGFVCLDFLNRPSYFGFPAQISNTSDFLAYGQQLQKTQNIEIIIKSDNLPPKY